MAEKAGYIYKTGGTDEKKQSGVSMIISEHKGQWKKIYRLSVNTLIKTYKGALLGPAWAIIKPSFTLFILWFAFSVGIRKSATVHGFSMFMFMMVGYIPWFYINEAIVQGARSIRNNRQYVTKLSFPMSNIMTFTNLSSYYVHLAMCVLMYIVLVVRGHGPSLYNLEFFYYCPLMFIFFWILTWTTAPMAAFSKDFENLINSIMTGMFWLSGIVWDPSKVDNVFVKRVLYFNPINYFINGYRRAFLYEEFIVTQDNWLETAILYGEMLLLILLGSYYYRKLRKLIPDVL